MKSINKVCLLLNNYCLYLTHKLKAIRMSNIFKELNEMRDGKSWKRIFSGILGATIYAIILIALIFIVFAIIGTKQ